MVCITPTMIGIPQAIIFYLPWNHAIAETKSTVEDTLLLAKKQSQWAKTQCPSSQKQNPRAKTQYRWRRNKIHGRSRDSVREETMSMGGGTIPSAKKQMPWAQSQFRWQRNHSNRHRHNSDRQRNHSNRNRHNCNWNRRLLTY
jgi:hypothetical protein